MGCQRLTCHPKIIQQKISKFHMGLHFSSARCPKNQKPPLKALRTLYPFILLLHVASNTEFFEKLGSRADHINSNSGQFCTENHVKNDETFFWCDPSTSFGKCNKDRVLAKTRCDFDRLGFTSKKSTSHGESSPVGLPNAWKCLQERRALEFAAVR